MSEDLEYSNTEEPRPTHYHGDTVRILFLLASGFIFATRFVGNELPFSFGAIMMLILALVIAAGITNPAQRWIHTANMILAIAGTITFGSIAFSRIDTLEKLFSGDGLVVLITLLFLSALYFATRTVRGLSVPHIDVTAEN